MRRGWLPRKVGAVNQKASFGARNAAIRDLPVTHHPRNVVAAVAGNASCFVEAQEFRGLLKEHEFEFSSCPL